MAKYLCGVRCQNYCLPVRRFKPSYFALFCRVSGMETFYTTTQNRFLSMFVFNSYHRNHLWNASDRQFRCSGFEGDQELGATKGANGVGRMLSLVSFPIAVAQHDESHLRIRRSLVFDNLEFIVYQRCEWNVKTASPQLTSQ